MLDWIKNINKPTPTFWLEYIAKFSQKSTRYVVISTQSTGINPKNDTLISIGAITIIDNQIVVKDSFELSLNDSTTYEILIEKFINYIQNSILIGHKIYIDIEIINEALSKLNCGRLKNEALDIEVMHKKWNDLSDKSVSLNEILSSYNITPQERTNSMEDAFSIALLFLKLRKKLKL